MICFSTPAQVSLPLSGEGTAHSGRPGRGRSSLDLFVIDRSGRPSRVAGSPLPPHSRTGALVVDRREIYVGVPAAQRRPAEVREYRLLD